jgi:tetratricopeptide (TPR) repeat protein
MFVSPCIFLVALPARQPSPSPPSDAPPAPTTASTGLALAAQGKLAEALPLLEAECASSPDDPKLGVARAQCLLDLARWKEALAAGQALLEKFPGDSDIRVVVGEVFFVSFRPAEAVETWRPLLKDPKECERALPRMLGALLAQRRFDEAEKLAREAKTAGVVFNNAALSLAAQTGSCPERLAYLEELGNRHPDDVALTEAIKVLRGVCDKGGTLISTPQRFPDVIRASSDGFAIKVFLNGKKATWLKLDSGTEPILLDTRLANDLSLAVLGKGHFEGLGTRGAESGILALLPSLEAGHLRMTNLPVLVTSISDGRGTERSGITGFAPFSGCMADWDRRRSRLTLWPAGTDPIQILGKAPDLALPVLWIRGIPFVQVTIDGKGPYPFLFDTGASCTILAASATPLLGLHLNSGKFQPGVGVGASGLFLTGYAEDVRLSLGAKEEAFPWVRVAEIPKWFSLPVFGILGQDVLYDYRVVFDGPASRILLLRYSGGRYRDPTLKRLSRNLPPNRPLPSYIPPAY